MRKRILIVASTVGYQTNRFLEAAKRLGSAVQLATDRCHILNDPWGDQALAVRFETPEGAAEEICKNAGQVDGIIGLGDRQAYIAATAAARLGVPYSPPEAVAAARDKFLARQRFELAGLQVPRYAKIPVSRDGMQEEIRFPCVLKPTCLSASRGVIRANNTSEFRTAFARIRALLQNPEIRQTREEQNGYIQVEDYIPGREFALEGILHEGRLRTLALFDKPDPLEGPFFEETIYTSPSRESPAVQSALIETTQAAIRALGLTYGPVHAEMRYNDQGVWMLEVANRPIGGLCAKVMRFSGDQGLEELLLRDAAGEDTTECQLLEEGCGVMMIPIPSDGIYENVSGLDAAEGVSGSPEIIITAQPGQRLLRLPEGNSYLGFIFARAATAAEAERILRAAHAKLNFHIAPHLPVLSR